MNLSLQKFWICLTIFGPTLLFAQVEVIDIIPKSLSDETNNDSEPNLAVNPAKPLQIAASAFTPDPLGGNTAPIFISVDGGRTWALNSILPSQIDTGDVTLRFGGTSNVLYAAILRQPIVEDHPELVVCRTANFTDAKPMDELLTRRGEKGVDQPYVAASTIAGKDRVFIGDNDLNDTGGHTASVDRSLDCAVAPAPAGFYDPFRIETRPTFAQDGPQIRAAIASDGKTVYSIFYGWTTFDGRYATADVVVVRDSSGGEGKNLFIDLKDPKDKLAGIRVATKRKVPWNYPRLGGERVGGDAAIAVDPRDMNVVYIAWADEVWGHYTLHVMRSKDGGSTWSPDVRTLKDAKNPGLAVNNQGVVGFLYQQVVDTNTGQDWVTSFEETADGFTTSPRTIILSRFPVPDFAPHVPFIGDYLHLMAVGNDFHGIFSASNTPDKINFPSGVVFQRNADFTRKVLLSTDNSTIVDPSIDPYYFEVTGSMTY
jgi:hypothetical protein